MVEGRPSAAGPITVESFRTILAEDEMPCLRLPLSEDRRRRLVRDESIPGRFSPVRETDETINAAIILPPVTGDVLGS